MIGQHLGARASALLDGQLSGDEEERAWAHVHSCHTCRDLVEREGWLKNRLQGLSYDVSTPCAPDRLKQALMSAPALPPGEVYLMHATAPRNRRGLAVLGGGAVGVAVMGVLALGAAPASAPTLDRRVPASVSQQGPAFLTPAAVRRTQP